MSWFDILKGKTYNRKTKKWEKWQKEGKVDEDPRLPHKFTGRRRDITGDPEGSGHRDVAAGKTKGARKGQRAKPPIAISGGGARSKGKRRRQDLKEDWDAENEYILEEEE